MGNLHRLEHLNHLPFLSLENSARDCFSDYLLLEIRSIHYVRCHWLRRNATIRSSHL